MIVIALFILTLTALFIFLSLAIIFALLLVLALSLLVIRLFVVISISIIIASNSTLLNIMHQHQQHQQQQGVFNDDADTATTTTTTLAIVAPPPSIWCAASQQQLSQGLSAANSQPETSPSSVSQQQQHQGVSLRPLAQQQELRCRRLQRVGLGMDVLNMTFQFLTRIDLGDCAGVKDEWRQHIRRATPYSYSSPNAKLNTVDINDTSLLLTRRRLTNFELKCTSLNIASAREDFVESSIGDLDAFFAHCPLDVKVGLSILLVMLIINDT